MCSVSDFIKQFKKDPFSVSLNLEDMKNGRYLFEGEVSSGNWLKACERIQVPQGGKCFARLIVEKNSYAMDFESHIECTMVRECVRTLENFEDSAELHYKERVYLQAQNEDEEADMFEGSLLDVGDILVQHIILEMNPYPVHSRFKGAEQGDFDVLDGQQDAVEEEKNPFSVLKSLKS